MRLEREVGVLIRRVRRVIGERARAVHEDLQPASYLMLAHLAEQGPTRASAIAELFSIDKGAISRQVTHLIELGLVQKTQDPEDGRAWQLSATEEAVRRLRAITEQRRLYLAERLGEWRDDELDDLVSLLGRYNASLGKP